jgi:acyl-CoA reductase-like NAD-dependent aldehyde dehydrogenase
MDPSKRERILWTIGDLLMRIRTALATTISEENGKTLREAARRVVMSGRRLLPLLTRLGCAKSTARRSR